MSQPESNALDALAQQIKKGQSSSSEEKPRADDAPKGGVDGAIEDLLSGGSKTEGAHQVMTWRGLQKVPEDTTTLLGFQVPKTPLVKAIEAPDDAARAFAPGILSGVINALFGGAQLALDTAGTLSPKASKAATAVGKMGKELKETLEKANEKAGMGPASETAATVGGFTGDVMGGGLVAGAVAGGVLPEAETVAGRLATGAAAGAGAAGSSLMTSTSPSERWLGRVLNAGMGAATGGAMETGAGLAAKLVNQAQISRYQSAIKGMFQDLDPSLSAMRGTLAKKSSRVLDQYKRYLDALQAAEKRFGTPDDASVPGKLRDLANEKFIDPNPKALKVLKQLTTHFPVKGEVTPQVRKALGVSDTVPEADVKNILAKLPFDEQVKLGYKSGTSVTYSELKGMIADIDNFIDNVKPGDKQGRAVVNVEKARQVLQHMQDDYLKRYPYMADLQKNADNFYRDKVRIYDDPKLKEMLATPDPLRRAQLAVDIIGGSDRQAARQLVKLVGPKGLETLRYMFVKRGLDLAYDPKSGEVDPDKFVSVFTGEGWDAIKDNAVDEMKDGIKNLLTTGAFGGTPGQEGQKVKLPHMNMGFATLLGMEQLAQGHITKGVTTIAGTAAVNQVFGRIEKVLRDKFGRKLIQAAASAKPNSPQMARIVDALSKRFISPGLSAQSNRYTGAGMDEGSFTIGP